MVAERGGVVGDYVAWLTLGRANVDVDDPTMANVERRWNQITKRLGTGIISTALKQNRASENYRLGIRCLQLGAAGYVAKNMAAHELVAACPGELAMDVVEEAQALGT